MVTSNKYSNITQKKLLGYQDLNDRFLTYLKNSIHENLKHVWDEDIVLGDQLTIEADGANAFKITGTSVATDGVGHLLKISDATINDGISFENTSAVDYYVGLKYVEIPNEIDINPRTGLPEYRSWIEEIGESSTPNSVTDNGNGTINMIVDSVTESGVDNSDRQVLVYKTTIDKNATTPAVAIEICTVTWSSTNNVITTTGSLGQSTISTVSGDYKVVLLGPTVKRYTDLRSELEYVFIGVIEGNGGTPTSFDMGDQTITTITMNDFSSLENEMRLLSHISPKVTAPLEDSDFDSLHRNSWYLPYNYGGVGSNNALSLAPPSGYNTTCVVSAIISGRLKNIFGSRSSFSLKVVDDETLDIDTVNLYSYFPATASTDWRIFSMCKDGNKMYVIGVEATAYSMVVHCFDIDTWTPTSGWPSTGTVVTTLSGLDVTGVSVINADDDYIAVSRPDSAISSGSSAAVSIYDKSDGSLLGSGAGDCPSVTNGSVKWISSNGTYVFFHVSEAADGHLCSMEVTNPGANGIGGSYWPVNTGYISDDYGDIIAFGDLVFITVRDDVNIGELYSVTAGKISVLSVSDVTYCSRINRAIFDGNNIWALGERNYGTLEHTRATLFKISVRQLTNEAIGLSDFHTYNATTPIITPYSYEYDTDDHFDATYGIKHRTPLLFNGKDIWVCGNDYTYSSSGRLTGYIYRVPRIFNL
jgi:hypothetical protein